MKRFFTTSFIALALFALATGAAPVAHAAGICLEQLDSNVCLDSVGDPCTCPVAAAPAASAALQSAEGNPNENATAPDTPSQLNGVMAYIAQLFAWLLGVAAITLDNVMFYLVVKMGSYVGSLSAVGVAWRVLRDLGNIILIFGFLAVGIGTILNAPTYGIKKMLPTLLIVAIFLNFSLFIAEAVIDTGNLFATQFYTQINGNQAAGAKTFGQIGSEGISNAVMTSLGLQTIYGNVKDPANAEKYLKNSGTIGFMSIILFIVAAFVMFSLSFILIARFVALIFLIIVAPIGFAGLVVPKLEGTAKEWWSQLFKQTITAPVLLLLLYIALTVITDAKFLTGVSDCVAGSTASNGCNNLNYLGFTDNGGINGFASVILSFLVAMGLLLAVVMVSKKMSAFGASMATKWAGVASFGVTGWAVNRTIGRGAYYAARGLRQSKTFNKWDARTGRVATRLLDRGAKGSFDLRSTKALSSLPFGGVDAGQSAKDGFTGARTRSIKDHDEAAKQIEQAYKDKGSARFESEIAAERAVVLAGAQNEKGAAQKAKENMEAEVERLKSMNDTSPEHMMRLDRAEAELTAAENRLTTAVKDLAVAEKSSKEDLGKAAGDRMKGEITSSKTAYAENITFGGVLNPFNLIGYGPSSGAAARKIKESLKDKGADAKLAEAVRKAAKEAEPAESTEKPGAVVAESAKPAAPSPAEPHA